MRKLYLLKTLLAICLFGIWGGNLSAQTDVLTSSAFGVSGGGYTAFEYTSATTSAVYEGKCAASYSSIQLNATNPYGLVVKKSPGILAKITIEWNVNTTSDRDLQIYGSNTPYESSADLYNTSKQGTLLATFNYPTKGQSQTNVLTFPVNGEDYAYFGIKSKKALYLKSITVEWTSADPDALAAPIITGTTPFGSSTEVTITGAEGSTIYYTTDGNDPTTASSVYSAPFTISAATTVKAIAVKDDKTSSVASKEFEKLSVLEGGLSALVAKIREDNSTSAATYLVKLTGAVVTGVDGSNVYLEENGTGLLLYKSGHGLSEGDVLSGDEVTVTGLMYNGIPEITSFTGETRTTDGTLPLTEVTLAELAANPADYMSRRVQVKDATVTVATEGNNTTIEQDGTSLVVYDRISSEFTLAKKATVTLTGYVSLKSGKVQINVLNADDVTAVGGLQTPNFYFSQSAVSLNIGGTFTAPTLTNTSDGTVAYSSSNEEVATVSADGVVTINGVAGNTTITAKIAETATYTAAEASYTLTVVDPNAPVYVLVTSEKQLVPGDSYLIASKENNRVMGWQKNTSSRATASATFAENKVLTTIATAKNNATDAFEFILGGNNGQWTLYDPLTQGYLTSYGNSNGIKTNDNVGTNSKMEITFVDANGNLNINFTAGSNNSLRCNLASEVFRCYGSSSSFSKDVQLYHKVEGGVENYPIDITLTAEDEETETFYGTYYCEDALRLPETGLEAAIITDASDNGVLTIDYRYTAGATIPAKTAVILKSSTTEHTLAGTTSDEAAPTDNLLHGADAVDSNGKTFVAGTNVKYYILTSSATKKLGFYWAAPNGAAVTYQKPYAFLALGGAAAVNGLFFNGETTGIEGVETENNTQAIFDLSGRRVQKAEKGIYIVNGKKVLVK